MMRHEDFLGINRVISSKENVLVSASITRAANTTQYSAQDQVAASTSAGVALTFSNCARESGGSGRILVALMIDSAAASTKPDLHLYLFRGTAAPTSQNDNAAWAPIDGDIDNLVGMIDFATVLPCNPAVGADGNCASFVKDLNLPFVCDNKDLYGLVIETATYTPISGEKFTFNLYIEQD